jgi:hypothetical protein
MTRRTCSTSLISLTWLFFLAIAHCDAEDIAAPAPVYDSVNPFTSNFTPANLMDKNKMNDFLDFTPSVSEGWVTHTNPQSSTHLGTLK